MRYISLGNCGLETSTVGLGCMGLTFGYGLPVPDQQARETVQSALDLGVTMFDTAEMYGPHTNEELLGSALGASREKYLIATKFGVAAQPDGSEKFDGSPENVRRSIDGSLERLGTDYIDLLYQHRIDPDVPIEETVGALAEEVQAGRVRYIGLSEASSDTIRRAHKVHPLSAVQSEYSLFSRDVEADVLPTLQELGIGFVAYSPLGRGLLTGSITDLGSLEKSDRRLGLPRMQKENFDKNMALVTTLAALADELGVTPSQVALAWVIGKTGVAAIPGTTKASRVAENVAAVDCVLTEQSIDWLENNIPIGAVSGERLPEQMMKDVNR